MVRYEAMMANDEKKSFTESSSLNVESLFELKEETAQWPIKGWSGKSLGNFGVGDARHQVGKTKEELEKYHGHAGIDMAAEEGSVVFPMLSGRVIAIKTSESPPSGKMVAIQHTAASKVSRYMHLKNVSTAVGEFVNKDTPIGTVGNTGTGGTAPHLHFEITEGFGVEPRKDPKEIIGKNWPSFVGEDKAAPKQTTASSRGRAKLLSRIIKTALNTSDPAWEDEG